jgi:DNA-binding NarL/FixJ family response regulator
MIRVLIADDHVLVRSALARLLDATDDIDIVGEAGDGDEAVAMAAQLSPDVVLMDLAMPGTDGEPPRGSSARPHPTCRSSCSPP